MTEKKNKIPAPIIEAAQNLLDSYGVDLKSLLLAQQETPASEIQDTRAYLTASAVKKDFGISRWTLWRMIKENKVKAQKLSSARSGKVLVERQSLLDYLRSQSWSKVVQGC